MTRMEWAPKRIEITLATPTGVEDPTITATRPTPGSVLAVHAEYSIAHGNCDRKRGWVLTHIDSGRSVGLNFARKKQALALAFDFGERPEWGVVADMLKGKGNFDKAFVAEFTLAARNISGLPFTVGGAS